MRKIIAVLLLLILGGCMPLHDQPDWLVGKDPIEAARRQVQGVNFGQTGELLWSTSFEDGLSDVDTIPSTNPLGYLTSEKSAYGGVSYKLLTAYPTPQYSGISKFISPMISGRLGIEIYFRSKYVGVTGARKFTVRLQCFSRAWGEGEISALVSVNANGATNGNISVVITDNVEVDTGISIPDFFEDLGDDPSLTYFHQLKLVADMNNDDPKYAYLIIDGVYYDLSDYIPRRTNIYPTKEGTKISVYLGHGLVPADSGYLDQVIFTYNEP